MDGTVMGGGVGISLPAAYRIATERTRFAMPETGIGLFPDVGAGWFLPRLHGRTGLWLALTGARLGPADCELLGLATDVVASSALPALKAALAAEPQAIERILTEHETDPGRAPIAAHRDDEPRNLADDLKTEYRLAARLVMRHDFREGVRAVIVHKDNAPRWRPASLAEADDALVETLFAPLPADQEWTPLAIAQTPC
jgi:enoyl-CoA hydratase